MADKILKPGGAKHWLKAVKAGRELQFYRMTKDKKGIEKSKKAIRYHLNKML